MSNSGMNTGCAKCFILFMAIVILLQGVIYLGLPIFGIIERGCTDQTADITGNPFKFAVDLIYFTREKCGAPSITIYDTTVSLPINWPDSFEITNRVYIVMIVYMAVSALWILTSFLVIVTLCCSVTNLLLGLCYWPWFLSVIAGSILDAVATGYFINDIVHTTSAEETLSYIGAKNTPSEVLTFLQSFDAYFITPALVMALVSGRVVLIWLLNIIGTCICLSFSNSLAKRSATHKKVEQHRPVPAQVTSMPVQFEQPQQPMQQIQQYPPQTRPKPQPLQIPPTTPQRQSSMPYNNNPQAERQAPMQYINSPQPDRIPYDAIQTQTPMIFPVSAPSPNEGVENLRANELGRQPSVGGEVLTYRNTATHPDKLDYPAAQVQSPSPTPIEMRVTSPQLSVVSPLNNRYSTVETGPNQPQRVSEELRGQLPWSYTSMQGGKPQPPRKPQKIYPQIPEPDYTTHPGNIERPPTNAGEDGAGQQAQPGYSRW